MDVGVTGEVAGEEGEGQTVAEAAGQWLPPPEHQQQQQEGGDGLNPSLM